MSFIENLKSVLLFNREGMGNLSNDESATVQAFLIIIVASLAGSLVSILDFFSADTQELRESALMAVAIDILLVMLFVFFFSGIVAFVLRVFGGKAATIQCLRVLGFCQIFTLVGGLIGTAFSLIDLDIGVNVAYLFLLLGLVAFIVGLTAFSELSVISVIIAFIIALFITAIILVIILFLILIFVLAALLGGIASSF